MTPPVPMHRLERDPNFVKRPFVPAGSPNACTVGWERVGAELARTGARVIVVEAYPGTYDKDLRLLTDHLDADTVIDATDAFRPADEIDRIVRPYVTDDPVFGRLTDLELTDLLDRRRVGRLRDLIATSPGRVVVHGPGASEITRGDLLVYCDLPRWEAQQRQRRDEVSNLGTSNADLRASLQYKRAYFVDWRVADRLKRRLFDEMDFVLDTTGDEAKMIAGSVLRRALATTATRPFEVVPFFDPGPWGGQWMKQVCDLPDDEANYAWCFNCVPEENSLLLGFGGQRFEIPSLDLVLREPADLLGDPVRERFGDEFPIRFDFLDTVEGGNLSLQVHPLTSYIREHFGVHYTQDESYYMMDATSESTVYLGVREGVDRAAMIADLYRAQEEPDFLFPAERHVNRFPSRRHDHFLIPAGTIHCSGAGGMVLEISATPYIFTFKLWDWGRLGLDGRPRPINIERGEANIQWDRDTGFVREHLVNRITPLGEGDGWRAEQTGLHEAEFIDTHRHWFRSTVPHDAAGGVNVLNLVQGEEAVIESPDDAFDPFVIHYAETVIVPAAAGPYTIRPVGRAAGTECATIKAFVRDET